MVRKRFKATLRRAGVREVRLHDLCEVVFVVDGRPDDEHPRSVVRAGASIGANGAVLLVLASQPYDPDDYIREYDAFLAEVGAS